MINQLSQGYITQLDGLSTGGFVVIRCYTVIAVDGVTKTRIQVSGNHNLAAPPFRMVSPGSTGNYRCHWSKWKNIKQYLSSPEIRSLKQLWKKKVNSLDVHWISNNISTSSKSTLCYQLPLRHVKSSAFLPRSAKCRGEQEGERLLVLRSIEICHLGGGGLKPLDGSRKGGQKPTSTDLRWKAGCQQITCHVILKSGDQTFHRSSQRSGTEKNVWNQQPESMISMGRGACCPTISLFSRQWLEISVKSQL